MDESVALDASKQKDFVKSVRGIKKLLKKNKKPETTEVLEEATQVLKKKKDEVKKHVKKEGKVTKRKNRGLVYLSHIPHGFYEQQMTEYFKQFGVVTNARVIRSRRTGNSKGFAFVEFKEPAVAEIVAETMNNYLMGKRLIKAAYVPPSKQRKNALRKKWNSQKNPSSDERLMFKKKHNADKNDAEELKMAKKLLSNLSKTMQKLSNLGIDYDFFKPVDIPEALIDKIDEVVPQTETKPKKLKSEDTVKEIKPEPEEVKVDLKINKKKQPKQKQIEKCELDKSNETSSNKTTVIKVDKVNLKDGNKKNNKLNEKQQNKQQKEKEDKLKKAGVKGPENFISIKESDDSDSSIDFDSDEFEKMIDEENDDLSSGDETSESEGEQIQEITKIDKKAIGSQNKGMAKVDLRTLSKKENKGNIKPQSAKRKPPQSVTLSAKIAKFEKQNSKRPLKKLIKKRK